jgi:hypothetical protein
MGVASPAGRRRALIIHHLDDLDAKLEMFARLLRDDAAQGPLTARDPILGRPLLKRSIAEPPQPENGRLSKSP